MTDDYKGYRDPMLAVMKRFGVTVWCEVRARTTRGDFTGLVLPRSETADPDHLVLKLGSGYNVGLRHDTIQELVKTGFRKAVYKIPEEEFPTDAGKPDVILFGTGGTIASRLDYRTGAVIPAFSPGELYGSVPELADICNLVTEKLFGEFSENIGAEHYKALAQRIGQAVREGFAGVVIGHGTDTMHHTAAALSFMVQNLPIPVVMVGSQRSSDRPSSDAARNLIHATFAAAKGPIAEVQVCMFGPTSDRYALLHRGTRVRKMHSSYRSTFRTLGDVPLAMVEGERIKPLKTDYARRREDRKVEVLP
ncbi:MAG: asparaginase domain-containing protein, partial [Planctomycetota bacterium]